METVIVSVLEECLPRIERAFQKHGFVQAGELADRHGALQLTFMKETNGLALLVLLNEALGSDDDDYRGSIDVVAEVGDRFTRRRVAAFQARADFERESGDAIEKAVTLAESLKGEDLSDSFELRPPIVEHVASSVA